MKDQVEVRVVQEHGRDWFGVFLNGRYQRRYGASREKAWQIAHRHYPEAVRVAPSSESAGTRARRTDADDVVLAGFLNAFKDHLPAKVRDVLSLRADTLDDALDVLSNRYSVGGREALRADLEAFEEADDLDDLARGFEVDGSDPVDEILAEVDLDEGGEEVADEADDEVDLTFDPRIELTRRTRPHQLAAIDAIMRELRRGTTLRMQVGLPTGSGKTRVGTEIARNYILDGRRVLWIAKDWRLLLQAVEDAAKRRNLLADLGWIGTTGKLLREQGLPNDAGLLRFSTDATLGHLPSRRPGDVVPIAKILRTFVPDVVIWDECHYGMDAPRASRLRDFLTERGIPIVGLSATPKLPLGREVFGEPLVQFSYQDLATCEPQVVARARFETIRCPHEMESDKGLKYMVAALVARADTLGPTVVFVRKRLTADKLAKWLTSAGLPAGVYHDGEGQNQATRKAAFKNFKAGRLKVLVGLEMLTHGVDLPAIRTVVLARRTASEILFMQMVGRGSRLNEKPKKTEFTVLDFADTLERHQHLQRWQGYFTGASVASDSAEAVPTLPAKGRDSRGAPGLIEVKGRWKGRRDVTAWVFAKGGHGLVHPDTGAIQFRVKAEPDREAIAEMVESLTGGGYQPCDLSEVLATLEYRGFEPVDEDHEDDDSDEIDDDSDEIDDDSDEVDDDSDEVDDDDDEVDDEPELGTMALRVPCTRRTGDRGIAWVYALNEKPLLNGNAIKFSWTRPSPAKVKDEVQALLDKGFKPSSRRRMIEVLKSKGVDPDEE